MSETTHRVRTLRAGRKGHAGVLRRGDAASAAAVVQPGMHMTGTVARVKRDATCMLPMDGDEVVLSVGA